MSLPSELVLWARRHHVGEDAIRELAHVLGAGVRPDTTGTASESRVQSEIRLAGAEAGFTLWRNNVGVLKNENGTPVRYGLANDSPALNKRLKSADLIGWRRLDITADLVGRHVAQFVSIETKRAGWTFRGDEREEAQARWASLVSASGGVGKFATGPGDVV